MLCRMKVCLSGAQYVVVGLQHFYHFKNINKSYVKIENTSVSVFSLAKLVLIQQMLSSTRHLFCVHKCTSVHKNILHFHILIQYIIPVDIKNCGFCDSFGQERERVDKSGIDKEGDVDNAIFFFSPFLLPLLFQISLLSLVQFLSSQCSVFDRHMLTVKVVFNVSNFVRCVKCLLQNVKPSPNPNSSLSILWAVA